MQRPLPQRTPPRHNRAYADSNYEQSDQSVEDNEEEDRSSTKNVSGRHKLKVLETWDRTAMLDSEVNVGIMLIAAEKLEESGLVEWPTARRTTKIICL